MTARLGDRRLTTRPRIVLTRRGLFSVERLRAGKAQAEIAYTVAEAMDIAYRWAGENR